MPEATELIAAALGSCWAAVLGLYIMTHSPPDPDFE